MIVFSKLFKIFNYKKFSALLLDHFNIYNSYSRLSSPQSPQLLSISADLQLSGVGTSVKMEFDMVSTVGSTTKVKPNENVESTTPDMSLAQAIHLMAVIVDGTLEDPAAVQLSPSLPETIMSQIVEVESPSLYRQLKETLLHSTSYTHATSLIDEVELNAMEASLQKTYEQLEAKMDEIKENTGDMEVLAARFEVARFTAKSLGKDMACAAYNKLLSLPKLSSGKIIDAIMECARVASFYSDTKKNGEPVDKAVKTFQ
jgi:hypothetical protein